MVTFAEAHGPGWTAVRGRDLILAHPTLGGDHSPSCGGRAPLFPVSGTELGAVTLDPGSVSLRNLGTAFRWGRVAL